MQINSTATRVQSCVPFLAITLVLLRTLPALAQQTLDGAKACQAPEYFGICDAFVPGTMISGGNGRPLDVFGTWPSGPAEKAGVCPGDQIVAVDGVSALQNTAARMLRQITAASPAPVMLNVKRGDQELVFRVPRVRESTLAALSNRKWLRMSGPVDRLVRVPLDESPAELEQLEHFQEQNARRSGFKWVDGRSIPSATPEGQVKKLMAVRAQGSESNRMRGFVPVSGEGSYSAGFSVLLVAHPDEVWVDQILSDSPAYRAGLLPGDQLLDINGHSVATLTPEQLGNLLFEPDARRQMWLRIKRMDSVVTVEIETAKIQEIEQSSFEVSLPPRRALTGDSYVVGLRLLYADNPGRAVVEEVEYALPAFDARMHVGDLILAADGKPMENISLEELSRILSPTGPSEVTFEVSRLERNLSFRLRPVPYSAALDKIGRKITKFGPAPKHCPGS